MSHYFKHELIPSQHGFPKAKSTVTDLVNYTNFIPPIFSSQRRVDYIYSDLVWHLILLHKICVHVLSVGYVVT
jgi:hypothetical protein